MWADSDLRGSQTSPSSQRLLKHSVLGASRLSGSESSRRDLRFCVSRRFLCQPHPCAGSPRRDKLHRHPGPQRQRKTGLQPLTQGPRPRRSAPRRAGLALWSALQLLISLCCVKYTYLLTSPHDPKRSPAAPAEDEVGAESQHRASTAAAPAETSHTACHRGEPWGLQGEVSSSPCPQLVSSGGRLIPRGNSSQDVVRAPYMAHSLRDTSWQTKKDQLGQNRPSGPPAPSTAPARVTPCARRGPTRAPPQSLPPRQPPSSWFHSLLPGPRVTLPGLRCLGPCPPQDVSCSTAGVVPETPPHLQPWDTLGAQ